MAFDSLTQESSRVVALDKKDKANQNMIAICRIDAESRFVSVNRITSVYGKKNFEDFIARTYDAGLNFYFNDKTKEFVMLEQLQLPNHLSNSLCNNTFIINKSQEK